MPQDKEPYYIVSFSGGKDSTAMLLQLVEREYPINEVMFCDTGVEFPQLYEHVNKVMEYVNLPLTVLKAEHDFSYFLKEKELTQNRNRTFKYSKGHNYVVSHNPKGYGWSAPTRRWCTTQLKTKPQNKYKKELEQQGKEVFFYVGLAADETNRLQREANKESHLLHPLAEWGMTEADCLEYCYALGFDWGGLYEHFNRLGCFCCPLQSLDDLRNLRRYYPEQWQQLLELDTFEEGTRRTLFKPPYNMEDLEKRFAFEEQWTGKSLHNKEFFNALYKELGWNDKIR